MFTKINWECRLLVNAIIKFQLLKFWVGRNYLLVIW